MNEDFDPEIEDFYNLNCDADDQYKENQSIFDDFNNISFTELNSESKYKQSASNSSDSSSILKEEKHFPIKNQIEIDENPIQKSSINKKIKNAMLEKYFHQRKDIKKIVYNISPIPRNIHIPTHYNISLNTQRFSVYQFLFKITGAYLTQIELMHLRTKIFKHVLPLVTRDEQRSKVKNIQLFEKNQKKLIPLLFNPNIQTTIKNYVMDRRQHHEKLKMIENLYMNYRI